PKLLQRKKDAKALIGLVFYAIKKGFVFLIYCLLMPRLNWRNAMFDEYNALIKNKTWTSVPWSEGASRYKARLVANGSTQRKYAMEILEHAHMVGCNPSRTPIDTESKLGDGSTLVCLYVHDPREPYFFALKRILRYVQGTLDYGLQLFSSTTDSLIAYSDGDWAGCPTTRLSTSGYCVFLGNNLLSWSSKRQPTLSHSSAEAEYRGVANTVDETC
nr:ribonuclease H-like domain-containing protein [Tanacetum cinerariifolium]